MKYEQIMEWIEQEIESKKIKPSEKIPSIREICKIFNCSKVTAVKAYENLERKHVIFSVPKSGYYVVDFEEKENKNGEKIIDLYSTTPHKSVLPYKDFEHCITQAIDIYKEKLFLYTPPNGLESLINQLRTMFWDYQIFTQCKNIFVLNGSQQGLNILAQMPFPNGRKNILIEQPVYKGAMKTFEISGNNIVGIERGINGIDLNKLEEIFKNSEIKFFYTIVRYHNPLGSSYTEKEKRKIAALAEKYGVYIIEDDYLADIDTNPKSMPLFYYNSKRVIYIKSFSMVLLPGVRVGVIIIPDELIDIFQERKKWGDLSTSVISQGALEVYLRSGMFSKHKSKIQQYYSQKLKFTEKIIKNTPCDAIQWFIPKSGIFISGRINGQISFNKLNKVMESNNIILGDTKAYYLPSYYDDKFFNICISKTDEEDIKEAITKFIALVNKHSE